MSDTVTVLADLRGELAELDAQSAILAARRQKLVSAIDALAILNGQRSAPKRYTANLTETIVALVADSPTGLRGSEIAKRVNREQAAITSPLNRAVNSGKLRRAERGLYVTAQPVVSSNA